MGFRLCINMKRTIPPSKYQLKQKKKKKADIGRDDDEYTLTSGDGKHSCSYERPMTDLLQRVLSPRGKSLISQGTELGFPLCEGSLPPVSQECLILSV